MQANNEENTKIGLYDGLGGSVLLTLIKGRKDCNDSLRRKAESSLDIVGEKLARCNNFSFSNGIPGIGWLIEYCAQAGLLHINTDEILEDLDDEIYRFTLAYISKRSRNVEELLGLLSYYQLRWLSKNAGGHYYRRFTHFECIVLLIGSLKNIMNVGDLDLNREPRKFTDIAQVMLKFSHLTSNGLSESYFAKEFYQVMEYFIDRFDFILSIYQMDHLPMTEIVKGYMILCMTARQYNNPYWVSNLEACYAKLKNSLTPLSIETDQYKKILLMETVYNNPSVDDNWCSSIGDIHIDIEQLVFYLSNYKAFSLRLDKNT